VFEKGECILSSGLPLHYNFEIGKTLWRISQCVGVGTGRRGRVALQFPEGLLPFACVLADIITKWSNNVDTLIMGDVTYGV
jgi:2-(3-amino-3-carboxypropyl)histidine synthase